MSFADKEFVDKAVARSFFLKDYHGKQICIKIVENQGFSEPPKGSMPQEPCSCI